MAALRGGNCCIASIRRIVCMDSKLSPAVAAKFSTSRAVLDDKVIHTGQKWDKDDYRMARFVESPKQINERFAIDLINSEPPIPIKDRHVWCNGGGGPLGHPKVYINLDPPGTHACGYCGLRYEKEH